MNVEKLLQSMTLDEKIGQLVQLTALCVDDGQNVTPTGALERLNIDGEKIYTIGSFLNVDEYSAKRIQENYLKNSRLRIPVFFLMDVIHGYRTLYPINLGLACSFDMQLHKECSAMAAKEAALCGVHVNCSPMLDFVRDARWGRVMESTGEDVFLSSSIAKAVVEAFTGDLGAYKVATCVKHFAAYGACEAGRDYNTVDMSEKTLREFYLPAYKAAIDAGADLVMPAFNTFNGIPATVNQRLVKEILRGEWGFDGVVLSDYNAFNELTAHGYSPTQKDTAQYAIDNTVDIEMMSSCYLNNLKSLIEEGKVQESQIDEAVKRVLRLKEKLGLFENPYRDFNAEEAKRVILSPEHRAIARKAAVKSAVLLKNERILPFDKNVKKVAVVGPHAIGGQIIGNWCCRGRAEEAVDVYNGVKNKLPNAEIAVCEAVGALWDETDESGIAEAVRLAKESDVVVMCLGEGQLESGESHSRLFLDLPEVQYRLFEEVYKVNKKVAVVLFTGRPLAIARLAKIAPCILNMWFPGTEGGNAVADLVFGDENPSGKLSMSFPYSVGQCPVYYNHYNTGRPKTDDTKRCMFRSGYIDGQNAPLYPFGYGLSYTAFAYSDLCLSADTLRRGGKLTATVFVENTGDCDGEEVVQWYVRDLFGSTVRPVRELKGFERIFLRKGEKKKVCLGIHEEMLAFWNDTMQFVAETGDFEVYVGGNSDCDLKAVFALTDKETE